jgi:ankyrin repeat protein
MTIVDYAIGNNMPMLRRVATPEHVNAVSSYNNRGVLHWAALHHNIEMLLFWLALSEECNVNLQSLEGNTPLHDAVMPTNFVQYAPLEVKLELIKHLLNAGADITIRNHHGETPLMATNQQTANYIKSFYREKYNILETTLLCTHEVAKMEEEEIDIEEEDKTFFTCFVLEVKESTIMWYDVLKYVSNNDL